MTYLYNFPNASNGLNQLLVGTFGAVPILTPMFLLFIFCAVLIGGATAQSKRSGSSDIPMWSAIASISTLMVSLALSLTIGLIQLSTLVIVVVITIASGVWLFLDRNNKEI